MGLVPTLLIPIILSISACSSNPSPITEIRTTPIERPTLILPEVTTINSRSVEWKVVTPENIDSIFAEMQTSGQNPVLFVLTSKGYENLGLNMSEITRLIKEQQSIILAYKNYYEKADRAILTNNKQAAN